VASSSQQQVLIPPDTLPLAFGTGAIFGRHRSHREATRLVEAAIDCGITYLDTARMYGRGRAETVLGSICKGKRHQLILASKAGILPATQSITIRALGQGIRLLRRMFPPLHDSLRFPRGYVEQFNVFELQAFTRSVERSLRELNTDYLDILLLHECGPADASSPELLSYLVDLKKAGKIRAFGIASRMTETMAVLDDASVVPDVVQIPSAIWNGNVLKVREKFNGFLATHSSLTGRFPILLNGLMSNERVSSEWQSMTQVDPLDRDGMANLLLAHALWSNPGGVVIFSSSSPSNIVRNVERIRSGAIKPDQVKGLNELVTRKHVVEFFDSIFRNLSF
jgi:D-threo-aldose 1-dehydrogenase